MLAWDALRELVLLLDSAIEVSMVILKVMMINLVPLVSLFEARTPFTDKIFQ